MRALISVGAAVFAASSVTAQVPRAISVDPPRDSVHPARMEVLHIPSGGVNINGAAYIASGPGAHPAFIFFHGLPGNEKNLDLAQAVRRAGWNAITVNYRGSWGSPGEFRFGGTLQDAEAVLAFVRDTANARRLGIDARRVVIAGHSMGGWVTALTAAHHPELLGAILISAADLGLLGSIQRDTLAVFMADNMESLSGVTAQSMADDLIDGAGTLAVRGGSLRASPNATARVDVRRWIGRAHRSARPARACAREYSRHNSASADGSLLVRQAYRAPDCGARLARTTLAAYVRPAPN